MSSFGIQLGRCQLKLLTLRISLSLTRTLRFSFSRSSLWTRNSCMLIFLSEGLRKLNLFCLIIFILSSRNLSLHRDSNYKLTLSSSCLAREATNNWNLLFWVAPRWKITRILLIHSWSLPKRTRFLVWSTVYYGHSFHQHWWCCSQIW